MDPRTDPRMRRRRREAHAEARVEGRVAQARERHAGLLEHLQGLECALVLQGEPIGDDDGFVRLCREHIARGFVLPPMVEIQLRRRITDGVLVERMLVDDFTVMIYELLTVAAMGLRGRRRQIAWNMLDNWEREGRWSEAQVDLALEMLGESRNSRCG